MPNVPSDTWYCGECGTLNPAWIDVCPVCNRGERVERGYGGHGMPIGGAYSVPEQDSSRPSSSAGGPVWSRSSSVTSATSTGVLNSYGSQDFILQEIVELLLDDGVTHTLLSKASQIGISSERIERRLRALLKDLGADLKTESKTVEERRIAKFVALKSRPVASAVVNSIEGFEDAARDIQGKERVEDSSEEDTESETDEPVQENEENDLARAKRSVVESAAFASMHQQLWHSVFPTLNSKMLAYVEKAGEDLTGADKNKWSSEGRELAAELVDVRLSSVSVCRNVQTSTLDRIKHTIEAWTEETWNWWPSRSPLLSPGDNYTYIEWICCGESRLVKAPIALAEQIERWKRELPERAEPPSKSTVPSPVLSIPRQQTGIQKRTGQGNNPQPNRSSSQNTQTIQGHTISASPNTGVSNGWVFLVVHSSGDYGLAQIDMIGRTTDLFFTQLRSEYLRLRGYITRCFSVWCYSHCDFYKFHKWTWESVVPLKRNQYPDPLDAEYDYVPKPIPDMPPITKHEFRKRHESCSKPGFHLYCNKQCPCMKAKAKAHNRDIIDLLPKKHRQLDLMADEREFFWGLYARQEISFFRVLVYNAICISPFVWFFFMWLFAWGHKGDQQNASVPLMTMLSFLSIFWTTFIASLWQKSDGDTT